MFQGNTIISKITTIIRLIKHKNYKTVLYSFINKFPICTILDRRVYRGVNKLLSGYQYRQSFDEKYFSKLEYNCIPWMTYPFIDFVKNLDLKNKTIFEYGSGASTIFWGRNASKVVSIENDEDWYNLIKNKITDNTELKFRGDITKFIESINEDNKSYDIIILDGGSNRYECALKSINKLNRGGMIILDDSDNLYYKRICDFLKYEDLLQIDFIGFKPRSENIVATSVFLKRDFNFTMKYEVQPRIFIGENRNYEA